MTFTWDGGMKSVQQITTLTVGSNTNTHTFIVSMKHPSGLGSAVQVITTVTADGVLTTTQLASAILALLQASRHPWVYAVDWSSNGAVITGTAKKAGVPFIMSLSGTGTFSASTTTANQGPNVYSLDGNWVEGDQPAANADIVIQGSNAILYGLDAAIGTTTDTFWVRNFTGQLGWPGYPMPVQADEEWVFDSPNAGLMFIQNGDTSITLPLIQVNSTGGGFPYGLYIGYDGTLGGGLTRFDVRGGRVLWEIPGNTATAALLNLTGGGVVHVGQDAILVTSNVTDGNLHILPGGGAPTTLVLDRGTLTIDGALAVTTATINGGVFYPNSTGTITTLNQYGGLTDFTRTRSTRTITNIDLQQAGRIWADTACVTLGSSAAAFVRKGPLEYRSALAAVSNTAGRA